MRLRLLAVMVWVVQGCGGDNGNGDGGLDGSPTDGTVQNDAGSDSPSSNDTGANDTGMSEAGQDGGNGIGTWTCGKGTVSDCSLCDAGIEPCVYCQTDGGGVMGACTAGNCFAAAPKGYGACKCQPDAGGAATCPPGEGFLVCFPGGGSPGGGLCLTCGNIPETKGLTCENGGSCDGGFGSCM